MPGTAAQDAQPTNGPASLLTLPASQTRPDLSYARARVRKWQDSLPAS